MIRTFWRLGWTAVLAGAVAGCAPKSMVQQKTPPPDPLLVTRKPIEGTARPDAVELTARLQPPAPPALAVDPSPRGADGTPAIRAADLRLGASQSP